jgi:hypothetical protein
MAVMTEARDQAIRDLTRHCGDGRLTLDELEERIDEVNRATTDDEIRHALRELPVTRPEPAVADEPVVAEEHEHVRPDHVFTTPRRIGRDRDAAPWEKSVGTACCIGGFVLLFNGMFWLALLCWFVLPGLIIRHRAH